MYKRPFKLSATLIGHTQDVKSVKFCNERLIFSCARDTTARVWKKNDESMSSDADHQIQDIQKWNEAQIYQNSNPGFLNAIEEINFKNKDYLVSAGQDALIQLWPLKPEPEKPYEAEFFLAGHVSNVCCLNVCKSGPENKPTIFSGSWDCSALVWRNNVIVHTLQAHSAAVWTVLGLADTVDSVLTGGADNLIILWKLGKPVQNFKGHTQAVRALVKLPQAPNLFASAGNDATVRIWNLDGQSVRVLDGHDSFIYSMTCLPTGEIVSSGEDRTVRIWDPISGQLTQTLTIPAVSVWTVSACAETGDIVCGSSDNMIRIFTREEERLASSSQLSEFDESVKASSVPSATVGDIKKSDLPSVAILLSRRGKKEGEVAMARNETNGAIEAFQWDGMKGDWSMVGTVTDGIGSARKQLFEGKEYDYVFDVDIKDGVPPLKLPYNASDNPYIAAQKWLAKHELPESYVDQVVEFIDKNTSGVALGGPAPGADPFTGAGSYRPGTVQNANSSNFHADPFTGIDRYRPDEGANFPVGHHAVQTKRSNSLLPHKSFLTFPSASSNFAPVVEKIRGFNLQLDDPDSSKKLDSVDLEALDSFTSYLTKPTGIPPELGMKVLEKMISNWPIPKQFPAIDIIRITSMSFLPRQSLPTLLSKIQGYNGETGPAELNVILTLRALSNGLSSSPVATKTPAQVSNQELARKIYDILSVERTPNLKMPTKNSKVALATLLLNLSILSLEGVYDSNELSHLLSLTSQLIAAESEEEAIYRSLIGMGNLAFALKNLGQVSDQHKTTITDVLSSIKVGNTRPNRLSEARREVHSIIK